MKVFLSYEHIHFLGHQCLHKKLINCEIVSETTNEGSFAWHMDKPNFSNWDDLGHNSSITGDDPACTSRNLSRLHQAHSTDKNWQVQERLKKDWSTFRLHLSVSHHAVM